MKLSEIVSGWLAYLANPNPHVVTLAQLPSYSVTEVASKTNNLVTQKYMPFFYFSRNHALPSGHCSTTVLHIDAGYAEYNAVEKSIPAFDTGLAGPVTGDIFLAVLEDNSFAYMLSAAGNYKNVMKIGSFNAAAGTVSLIKARKIAATEIGAET